MGTLMEHRRQLMTFANYPLPQGYKKCDYLQTSGYAARIDTGVAGNDETLSFDFAFATITRQAYAAAFGNYADENTRCWRLLNPSGTVATVNYIVTAYNRRAGVSTAIQVVATGDSMVGQKVRFRISAGHAESICGNYKGVANPAADTTTAISSKNIAIGAPNTTISANATLVGRFWHFKIFRGATLIRNYLPCIRASDNKPGFWDTVNKTFNPSFGSADFVAGYDN